MNDPTMLSPDEHILGDSAYLLMDKVITPFRDNGNLGCRHRRHNFVHASARSLIERAFGLDKNLWRRQKLMVTFNPRYVVDTIVSSCVLHNFILLGGHPHVNADHAPLEAVLFADLHGEDYFEAVLDVHPALQHARLAGRHKRDYIAYPLHPYLE